MTPLHDAHNHLQDTRLDSCRHAILGENELHGIAGMVVNGTSAADWGEVAALAEANDWIMPSFGLHPWRVRERGEDWLEVLEHWLDRFPQAAVGEIGLDRWVENPDIEGQEACFDAQWHLGVARERAITVHCLKAFGWLEERLRVLPRAPRGFLLHSYGGPAEMVAGWVELGAYFSVSPYFAHERKRKQLEVFREVPLERLLIETDAPDMRPPPERNPNPLQSANGGEINHPANLEVSFQLLVELTGAPEQELAAHLEENWRRLFGSKS